MRPAQVDVRLSGPTQMVSTTSVVTNAATAAIAKRPKRLPSLPRALPAWGVSSRLDARAIDVLGERAATTGQLSGKSQETARKHGPVKLIRRRRPMRPGAAGAGHPHSEHVTRLMRHYAQQPGKVKAT